jgi:hypothetical protein
VFRGRYCYCFEEDNCCLNLYEAKGVHACSTPCVRLRGIGFCCTTFAVVKHCARNIFFENASFGHVTTVVAMLCFENILESFQASFLPSPPFPPPCHMHFPFLLFAPPKLCIQDLWLKLSRSPSPPVCFFFPLILLPPFRFFFPLLLFTHLKNLRIQDLGLEGGRI